MCLSKIPRNIRGSVPRSSTRCMKTCPTVVAINPKDQIDLPWPDLDVQLTVSPNVSSTQEFEDLPAQVPENGSSTLA